MILSWPITSASSTLTWTGARVRRVQGEFQGFGDVGEFEATIARRRKEAARNAALRRGSSPGTAQGRSRSEKTRTHVYRLGALSLKFLADSSSTSRFLGIAAFPKKEKKNFRVRWKCYVRSLISTCFKVLLLHIAFYILQWLCFVHSFFVVSLTQTVSYFTFSSRCGSRRVEA